MFNSPPRTCSTLPLKFAYHPEHPEHLADLMTSASPGNAILTTVLTPILGFLGSVLGTVTSLLVEVDVPTVADCRNKCNNTSGCVGFEYNGGKCGIKQNSDRVLRKLRPDRQKSTFVGGTCAQNAKISKCTVTTSERKLMTASAICCDSS